MNYFLPDWMFAAFAIGGWELFDLIARTWHVPNARWFGGGIVAVCIVVLLVRYIKRFVHRRKNPPREPGPDDWKNY